MTLTARGSLNFYSLDTEIPNSLKDPSTIYIAGGCPKLPKSGPGIANSPNDFYTICMTETRPESQTLRLIQVAYL